jgi:hypothetical protein
MDGGVGAFIALNQDGTEKWRIGGAVHSSPAISEEGTIYIGTIHSWTDPDTGYVVDFGYLHAINNLDPNAPYEPIIDGPTEGKVHVEYEYKLYTDDPNGNDVYYWILWGDDYPPMEWIGPYASGEEVIVKHTYKTKGTYKIKVRAKDTDNLWGPWGSLDVTMPLNQQTNQNSVKLYSKNSVLFQFLQQIMNI